MKKVLKTIAYTSLGVSSILAKQFIDGFLRLEEFDTIGLNEKELETELTLNN